MMKSEMVIVCTSSEDTNEESRQHVDFGEGDNVSKDKSYYLRNSSYVEDELLALEDVYILAKEIEEHFDNNEERIVA